MNNHQMHKLLTSDSRYIVFGIVLVLSLSLMQEIHAIECNSIKGIASNQIYALAGNRDTVWMLTYEGNGNVALNTLSGNGHVSERMVNEGNWDALYLCNTSNVEDIAYSSGITVVCSDSVWHQPNDVYVFVNDNGIKSKTLTFPWNRNIKNNDSLYVTAVGVTSLNNYFYFACLDGGIVRWNSTSELTDVLIPGKKAQPFDSFNGDSIARADRHVISVSSSGDSLLVTTSKKIWIYTQSDSSWDSTVTDSVGQLGITIKSFHSSFVNKRAKGNPLYAYVVLSDRSETEDSVALCKYDRKRAMWNIYMDKAPSGVTMGMDGVMYMMSFPNTIEVYVDTLGDSVSAQKPEPLIDRAIQDSMTVKYSIEFPSYINDLFFAPMTDTTGNLWIATSDGLFLSENISRTQIIRECILVKRAPIVANSLKKTYARPGILTTRYYESDDNRSVFVYNLSKDAKVTIRIYDYNMDHVKTVISGKPRKAGKNGGPFGRSTVESEDWWDGRNELGRLVAPGVYYFKITTDKGERSFGKMIVAK